MEWLNTCYKEGLLDVEALSQDGAAITRKLEDAVQEAKRNREWRHEYMTLAMRDQENIERGMEQGLKQGIRKGTSWGHIGSSGLGLWPGAPRCPTVV